MKIVEGKDGADLLPPWAYNPKSIGMPAYEMWKMQKNIEIIAVEFVKAIQPLINAINRFSVVAKEIPFPNEKAEARKRSREDMNRKRKDLMKRRGK